jgi:transglutaminase-like putative cysteine protease
MKTITKSILFPCLLGFITAVSVYCVYESFAILPVGLIFVFNAFLFIVYEKLRVGNKVWFSTIIIIAFLLAAMFIAVQIIRTQGQYVRHLGDWFFKTGDTALHFPAFTSALLIVYTPFISSTVFYFTNVRYNSFFVMLTCMTTFALYAKTFTDIPVIFPSLIIALILLISIEKRWYRREAGAGANKALSYSRFLASGMCFVALSAYVAGLFPPAETTPYREQFDNLISGGMVGMMNMTGLVFDSPVSGTAPRNDNNDEVVLFVVRPDEMNTTLPRYLRRQVFDNWNGENWEHYSNDTWLARFHSSDERSADNSLHISIVTGAPLSFLPVPLNSFEVVFQQSRIDSEEIAQTIRDEFFIGGSRSSRQAMSYTAYFRDSAPDDFLPFSVVEREIYLESTLRLPDYPQRERVRELADMLTADAECDYEKAKAIERYFYNGEFTYNLGFVPQSKAVDYFLFESKTGTCSDFASAMTILAREAGLPARYVEGYSMTEESEPGVFLIKLKHAHAFTEVFVPGTGWVIFEPTIPAVETQERFGYFAILTVLISLGLFAVVLIIFLIFALPKIKERRFRKTVKNSPREKQVALLYNKIYSEFMKKHRLQERTLSSRDLNTLASSQYGLNLYPLTENYDRVVYGGFNAAEGDFIGIYTAFFNALKTKKRHKKYTQLT